MGTLTQGTAMTSPSSAANVSPAEGESKARSISIPDMTLKVIDMAATLRGKSRSAYMVEHAEAAAVTDLRSAGIDPDAIRQAA